MFIAVKRTRAVQEKEITLAWAKEPSEVNSYEESSLFSRTDETKHHSALYYLRSPIKMAIHPQIILFWMSTKTKTKRI